MALLSPKGYVRLTKTVAPDFYQKFIDRSTAEYFNSLSAATFAGDGHRFSRRLLAIITQISNATLLTPSNEDTSGETRRFEPFHQLMAEVFIEVSVLVTKLAARSVNYEYRWAKNGEPFDNAWMELGDGTGAETQARETVGFGIMPAVYSTDRKWSGRRVVVTKAVVLCSPSHAY